MATARSPASMAARGLVGLLLAGAVGLGCQSGWQGPAPGVTRGEPARSSGQEVAEVGGSPSPPAPEEAPFMESVDETHAGELTDDDPILPADGSVYDAYGFEAVAGARIVVVLRSDDFEPYVHLIGPDGAQLAHGGHVQGERDVAEMALAAPASGLYQVYANALEPTMRGTYRLRIVALPPPRPAPTREGSGAPPDAR